MKRVLKVKLDLILDLISAADTYGYRDDVLFFSFAEMLDGRLSYDEIFQFANSIRKQDGYGQEDFDAIMETLTEFKNEYCD